ncbi:hypothetical protein LJC34_02555 [Oscillospiraceae bacterium OttesenSCG-928-G22]|nr:hypothetical protein [Oscillospiraceae bacterium OttesenSCG-928-G22]
MKLALFPLGTYSESIVFEISEDELYATIGDRNHNDASKKDFFVSSPTKYTLPVTTIRNLTDEEKVNIERLVENAYHSPKIQDDYHRSGGRSITILIKDRQFSFPEYMAYNTGEEIDEPTPDSALIELYNEIVRLSPIEIPQDRYF